MPKTNPNQRNKIRELEELAAILDSHRLQGKKIALSHGVFDLLHIGHIRHLEQAKKLGDLLVVTVTPDPFVNKGPHRPVFPANLRVEAIAALGCVDYVAINRWPTAVETIQTLRPHFYVKGPDYKEAEKDRTGGITLEESAVESVGGQLIFTEDITYSSSNLINRHLSIFSKEATDYLRDFSSRYRSQDVIQYLENGRSLKVLVVGEAIIDEYQYCEAIGKSSKEPMLAVKQLSIEKFAGGILAVGNHVANFCDKVGMVTVLGAAHSQEDFIHEKLNHQIKKTFLYRENAPTIVKRRFVENYFFTKLLELYEMNDGGLSPEENQELCAMLNEQVPQYDVVIVVDFGHGMLTKEAIQILCSKSRFLAVNAQSNAGNLGYHTISRYSRADYISMAESEVRLEARERRGDLKEMVLDVARRLACDRVIVTQGKRGCLCYGKEDGFFEVPAFAGQVIDRMGAGDAFLSLTALCVAQKAPMEVVGFIGNAVGAQAVATVGHRTSVERVPLFKQIESLMK
jgi:rfaE bifunctional protein kinase chain/domain/rfaE bifunctional protein nucleotidyltransferase chain/domain